MNLAPGGESSVFAALRRKERSVKKREKKSSIEECMC